MIKSFSTALTHKSPIARFYPNRSSWQIKGLLYWISPQMERHPSGADPFYYKKIGVATQKPAIWTDPEMGLAYRVGDDAVGGDAQVYLAKRVAMDYITCSSWVKGGTQSGSSNVIRGDDLAANRNFQFKVNVDKVGWIVHKRGASFTSLDGVTTTVDDGNWHHIAATYDGLQMRVFLDGKEDANPTALAGLLNNALGDYYVFGSWVDVYYTGLMGDTRIYNRALSPAEIYVLYNPATRWDLYKTVMPALWPAGVGIQGDTAWGHDTGVTETNVRDFSGNWTGTGAISGAGDAEIITLDDGENMVSEVVDTGEYTVTLLQNEYDPTGDDAVLKYRHGATAAACEVAGWNSYTVPFVSLGFVQVQLVTA